MTVISSGPGGARSFGPTSGGKLYAFNALDAVTPQQVAPANTSRTKITFHNPHATIDVLVYPQYKLNTGSNVANLPTVAAKGGGFWVYANGGSLTIEGEVSQAFFALAASGTTGALTVMDSNT